MDAGQLFKGRQGRIIVGDQHLHARGDEPVLNGVQSLGRLGVVRTHAMVLAVVVADESEVHCRFLFRMDRETIAKIKSFFSLERSTHAIV